MAFSALKSRIPDLLLFGPGPTNPFPSVYETIALPLVGHLDEVFGTVLVEIQEGLRILFGTKNRITFAVSGTGSSGMEFLAMNLIEPGDRVVVCVNGIFGQRICAMVQKLGASVYPLTYSMGRGVTPEDLRTMLKKLSAVEIVWVVHAETSTGYRQSFLKELATITHEFGGLFFLDCVTSLGGIPVNVDENQVDAAFSGSQKCLGVTPGLAPVTLGESALQRLQRRKHQVPSWYLDLALLLEYWDAPQGKRVYHHTAPIASLYALHEGIRILLQEGLEKVYRRYEELAQEFSQELEKRGFRYRVEKPEERLPMLHCVYPPPGISAEELRQTLRKERVEVGGALGELKGQAIRIGLMGRNMFPDRIQAFLKALDRSLATLGSPLPL